MCNYLKNIEGHKLKDLKLKNFDVIQKMFDKAFKRVNTFDDSRSELLEGEGKGEEKAKRAGDDLMQEAIKKQKVDDNTNTTELKELMKIISDEEEVAIDAIHLAVKSPKIVGWKIYKEEDLEDMSKLVKAKYRSTRPVEDLDLRLWGDLKTMFEPHVEDNSAQIYMLVEKKYPLTPPTFMQCWKRSSLLTMKVKWHISW
ncbi:hypothetical protein Tco_0231216 [Tanacetum coccineum]